MSGITFNPVNSHCADWRKINAHYKRHLDFGYPDACGHCGNPATNRCSACQKVAYCTADHQKIHWKSEHKAKCCPYKLATDPKRPELGRFVVATRDINPGEVIIEEPPVTAGPKQYTGPVCLGCHKLIDGSFRCECGWPVCSKECCYAPIHKATGECEIFAKSKLKPKLNPEGPHADNPIYECVTPMRCVLIKKQCPDNWEVMARMEQHTEQRKLDPFYSVNQTNTVRFLKQHMFPGTDFEAIPDQDINAMIDVLDVNAFEIRGTDFSMRGVYPLTAMMNSVCNPNTQNCIGRDFMCRVRAVVPIRKGQEITATYTLTLAGTMYRQRHLYDSKYFHCNCIRCQDPTELGSHFSTILCQACPSGLVTSTKSTDITADWKCNSCDLVLRAKDIEEIIDTLEKEVSLLPLERDIYEEKLKSYAKMLHANHHIMVDLKFTLVQLYGRDQPSKEEMMKHALRKKELCEAVINVMDQIIPGRFRLRGMFLSEMYGILFFLAKRAYENGSIDTREFRTRLEQARDVLDESSEILSYEPADTVEGIRCQTTREFRQQLEKMMAGLKEEKHAIGNFENGKKEEDDGC